MRCMTFRKSGGTAKWTRVAPAPDISLYWKVVCCMKSLFSGFGLVFTPEIEWSSILMELNQVCRCEVVFQSCLWECASSPLSLSLSPCACAWNSGRGLSEVLTKMSFNTPKRTGFVEAGNTLRELSCQMCGGEDLDSYLEELRSQGQSQCTNVWSKGNIAYRCRTCQIKDSRCCSEYFHIGPVFLFLWSLSLNLLSAMFGHSIMYYKATVSDLNIVS